jgi:hypothetical protein
MIALAAPLPIARPVRTNVHGATPPPRHPELVEGQPESGPSLEARIDASVESALAEALAKVKTPADDEVAKQQQAFDRMMQLRAEGEREANAIREFGLAQQKKENDFMEEFIRMI